MATARPLQTGIYDQSAYYSGDAAALDHTRDAGSSLARIVVNWYEVGGAEPPEAPRDPADPSYSWERVDRFVRQARANGLEPVLAVAGTPGWARARRSCTATVTCAPDNGMLRAFAEAAATRYGGGFRSLPRVRCWQVWSEPNLNFFLVPRSPRVYRGMVNAFSAGIDAGRPRNLVIAGGLAPLARPGATLGPLRFMRELLFGGPRVDFDIWSTHPYTTGGPTHSGPGRDDVSLGDLPQMTQLLRSADRRGRIRNSSRTTPFWVTEFSWDTRPPDPGGVPLRTHARWTAEALYRMWKAGVSAVFWFGLRDSPRGTSYAETYQSGLYFRRGRISRDRPKPAFRAFRFPFVALPSGARGANVWGRVPPGPKRLVYIQVRGSGGWRNVRSVRTSSSGIFSLRAPRPAGSPLMRAIAGPARSIPFEVRRTPDVYQPPFGGNPRRPAALAPRLLPRSAAPAPR